KHDRSEKIRRKQVARVYRSTPNEDVAQHEKERQCGDGDGCEAQASDHTCHGPAFVRSRSESDCPTGNCATEYPRKSGWKAEGEDPRSQTKVGDERKAHANQAAREQAPRGSSGSVAGGYQADHGNARRSEESGEEGAPECERDQVTRPAALVDHDVSRRKEPRTSGPACGDPNASSH